MESPLYLFLGDNLGLIFFSPTEEVTQKLHRVENDFTALAVSLTFTLDLIAPRNKWFQGPEILQVGILFSQLILPRT